MKKIIYLCTLIILELNVVAQIDLNDRNWDTIFYDDFSSSRNWNQSNWHSRPDNKWKAMCLHTIVHGGNHEHQIYQYQNCQFDTDSNTMKLISEYDENNRIPIWNYSLPNNFPNYPNIYGSNGDGDVSNWYFFSGAITTNMFFQYGYFEIKCSLPIHPGSFPAFWLFSSNTDSINGYYNEIDVFEYTNNTSEPNYTRQFSCGLYCDNEHNIMTQHAKTYTMLPANSPDLGHYHVFACEWMPYSVTWYVDGSKVNEYTVEDSIPHHPMKLITNYAIKNSVFQGNQLLWNGTDTMTIDYIKVCSLRQDCYNDEIIACQADLDNFDYGLKKTINVTSSTEAVMVGSTDKITFRMTDSFEITGPFTIEAGGEFTIIKQECF